MDRETRQGQTEIRRDGWIAFALATGFLLVYLRTLCPTTYLGDSGQISTAIVTGGIIHPPGYPLFSLLGRASLLLVPCGEPAFRVGCVVALAAAGLLLAASTVTAYNCCYDIADIAPYYIAAWIAGMALLAVALDAIRSRARGFWKNPALAAVLFAVIPGSLILRNGGACDLSRATWARDLARHKLEHTDPGGVLITQGDHDTFPIWYVHDVLHVRPDVLPLDRAMLAGTWRQFDKEPSLWYLRRLRRQGVDAPLGVPRDPAVRASLATDGYLLRLLQRQLRDRPLCMTFAATHAPRCEDGPCFLRWALARYEMLPQGVVLRLQPKSQPVDLAVLLRHDQQLWDRTVLPDLHAVRTDEDLDPDYVVNHYACMLVNYGGLHELAGHRDQAEAIYRRVVAWAPHYRPAAAALASLRRDGRQAQLPSDRR
jgi:hypothetical protein